MRDLSNKADTTFLVAAFYKKVLEDAALSPFFEHIDFEKHKPRMEHFWNFVLFDEGGYTTNVTEVHIAMPLKKQHFDRWIMLFNQTLDAHFAGENTEKAKQRAALIAWTIGSKITPS